MIIRKPYAFLIKHFKKIHIFLFLLCIYIYYKNMQLTSFIREFMDLGTYDAFNEPVTRYATIFSILLMIIVVALSVTLIFLLKHKNKPWKLYLVAVSEYALLFIIFIWARSYFSVFNGEIDSTAIRALRDFSFIASLGQYPVLIILGMRIFGVDLKKFNFAMDEEYLEMDSEDREELEININIDKESFKRGFKRLLRNLNYIYQEHKRICNTIAAGLMIFLIWNSYVYIFITNKSYKQGETLDANGYSITINNSYYTSKDYNGKEISKESNFVVIDLSVRNNSSRREIDTSKFHIINGINNYTPTGKTFETEFQDLGSVYQVKELNNGETINFILIFKVSKEIPANKFVLYYQELDKADPYLRKIKLNIQNISEIKENKSLNIGDKLSFTLNKKKQYVIIDEMNISDQAEYSYKNCNTTACLTYTGTIAAPAGNKVLEIMFSSNNYEGKDMIDFSSNYGKIKYIDSKNKVKRISVENIVQRSYYGKNLYIKIPDEVANSQSIELEFTVRNNKYIYKLK